MRLGWIRKETRIIYEEYPSTEEKGFHLRAIVRYYLGIRLNDFIEIREALYKDFKEMNKTELDECLKPFWEPIVKHKIAIAELRNSYLAHIQEKEDFERHINSIISDRQYPSSHADARFFAGCVWKYCDAVIFNFPTEWKSAIKKYSAYTPLPAFVHNIATLANAETALRKATDEAIAKLKVKGLSIS